MSLANGSRSAPPAILRQRLQFMSRKRTTCQKKTLDVVGVRTSGGNGYRWRCTSGPARGPFGTKQPERSQLQQSVNGLASTPTLTPCLKVTQ